MSLEVNQSYLLDYDYAIRPTNLSYSGTFYGFLPGDYIIINHTLTTCPDRVKYWSSPLTQVFSPLTGDNNIGDWYWNKITNTISYLIVNKLTGMQDFVVNLQIYKCFYALCQVPNSPSLQFPIKARPADALFWSNISTWSSGSPGYYGIPKENSSVLIPQG